VGYSCFALFPVQDPQGLLARGPFLFLSFDDAAIESHIMYKKMAVRINLPEASPTAIATQISGKSSARRFSVATERVARKKGIL
jgi:hypothetical protein